MFLCSLDGRIYDANTIGIELIVQQKELDGATTKECPIKVCCLCHGLLAGKYDIKSNIVSIPPLEKMKIYKISSSTFENKNTEKKMKMFADKPPSQLIKDLLKKSVSNINKEEKKKKTLP